MSALKRHWRLSAACRSTDPDLFFPVSSSGRSLELVVQAKEVCARCPVQRECLRFALSTRQAHGVWGGMSEEERKLLEATPHAPGRSALRPTPPSAQDLMQLTA